MKTGVAEWADNSINIQTGCSNNCIYCYARVGALRFGRIKTAADWQTEIINEEKASIKYKKYPGIVMFPTTHDITENNLSFAITTIKNLLEAGNSLLIVSKPRLVCIREILKMLGSTYKTKHANVEFRFTIGTVLKKLAGFWEPGAPTPAERLECLALTYWSGYKTSVSSEPMLGGFENAVAVYETVKPFITESVWFGKMNKIRGRVQIDSDEIRAAVMEIEAQQTDDKILKLYQYFKNNKKVQWKDSIKKIIEEGSLL